MDERSARWQRRFNVPVIVAALATVPLLVLEQSHHAEPLQTILEVSDWIVWGVFALELTVMLAVAPSRWGYVRAHPLRVTVVVLTVPLWSAALQSLRCFAFFSSYGSHGLARSCDECSRSTGSATRLCSLESYSLGVRKHSRQRRTCRLVPGSIGRYRR